MALVLTEEQSLLASTARDFLREQSPVALLRRLRDEGQNQAYCSDTWQKMVDLGWPGITLPEEYGGAGFGYQGLGCVMEEMGGVLAASPLFATLALCAPLVMAAGSKQQKQEVLTAVASGELTLALALQEQAHHDLEKMVTTAVASADGFCLNGRKVFVVDGASADRLLVVAGTGGEGGEGTGLSMFLLDPQTPGINIRRTELMDSRDTVDIELEDVQVPATALLGELHGGREILEPVLDAACILLAAEMLGGVQECFDRTLAHLKEREQFGVKIGSFQALKHRAAKLYIEIELAAAIVMSALSAVDKGAANIPQMASLAKARLSDLFIEVTNEAVQLHGGIGVTDELDIGLFLKRARVTAQLLGCGEYHRDRFGRLAGY